MQNKEKKKYLTLCLFFFTTLNLCSQSKEPLSIETKKIDKKEKNCTYKIEYPILKLGKNSKYDVNLIKSIGKILIDDFTKLEIYDNEYECNKNDKNAPSFSLNVGYEVKFKNESILSLYSTFSSFTDGNAHPNNIYKTYNFDLTTGKQIPFESLFKTDQKFLIPLHKYMAEALILDKSISDKEEFIAAKKNKYDYYLSPEGIHFINLFDVYVMQAAEAKVPYLKIKKYLDTEKTLSFVK